MRLGQTLNIATNPWSHHVLGEQIPKEDPEWSEINKYRNYWGYEIEMLKDTAKALNFTYTIENPPDGKWGHIEPDGNWNGLVYYVSKDNVDIVICDVFIVYGRQQVCSFTVFENCSKSIIFYNIAKSLTELLLYQVLKIFVLIIQETLC